MNQDLFEKKRLLLVNSTSEVSPKKFNLDFCFQRIEFRFNTDNLIFINELSNYLPATWQRKAEMPIQLFHTTPEIDIEEWDEEASQNCFISDNGQFIIQRDFAANRISQHKIVLFLLPTLKDDGFFNFMRWLLPPLLIKQNKFLFHCSAVVNNQNKAFIFLGHSGAGKTTICQLAGNRKIINDDMNIVEFKNGTAYVKTGGIGGAFDTKSKQLEEEFELDSLFWLKQSTENISNLLPSQKAYIKTMASFANINWNLIPQEQSDSLMNIAQSLSAKFNFSELAFLKSESIWNEIDP